MNRVPLAREGVGHERADRIACVNRQHLAAPVSDTPEEGLTNRKDRLVVEFVLLGKEQRAQRAGHPFGCGKRGGANSEVFRLRKSGCCHCDTDCVSKSVTRHSRQKSCATRSASAVSIAPWASRSLSTWL